MGRKSDRREQLLADLGTGVGASESHHLFNLEPYGCRRQLWYAKSKTPADFPHVTNRDMTRGTEMESKIAKLYQLATGRRFIRPGFQCYRHPWLPALLCHPDRLMTPNPKTDKFKLGLLEIKCPALRTFRRVQREGLPPSWIFQVQHGVAALTGEGCDLATIAVFNCEVWDLIHFDMMPEPGLIARIRTEVENFTDEVNEKTPPDRLPPSDPRCRTCPFRTKCQGTALFELRDRDEEQHQGEFTVDHDVTPLVQKYLEARELRDEAAEHFNHADEQLREALGDRQRVKCDAGRAYYTVTERTTVDAKKFKAENPDLAGQYLRTSASRSLRVYPS